MKLFARRSVADSPEVSIPDTQPGVLYRYDFKGTSLYLLATADTEGKRIFVDLATGDWYSGTSGGLFRLDHAELILGSKSK